MIINGPSDNSLRSHFLLDPDIIYLNHGSAGACPRPVFEQYQRWQLELEHNPVDFLGRRAQSLLKEARARVAAYLRTDPGNLVFVTNSTVGTNIVAHSLALGPEDEILTTDQEYGAMDRMWTFICGKTGTRYIHQPLALPVVSKEDLLESFWAAVTPRTRVIFISHITSPTALILPVAEICRRARAAGILTFIDGAHAPGQVPLDLEALGADFYVGSCHKWLCAPKGAAFLYVHPACQDLVEPLVVSWEWDNESPLVRQVQGHGTRDIAAYLSIPAAIEFQQAHDWDAVRARCHALAGDALQRLIDRFDLVPLAPNSPEWFSQMVAVPLPSYDGDLHTRLYEDYKIEVPAWSRDGRYMMRVSVQGYNTREDLDRLVTALDELYR